MAIVQDAYDLPNDILTKILTGEYRRIEGSRGTFFMLLYLMFATMDKNEGWV